VLLFVNKTILELLALVTQLKVERQIINVSFKKLPEEEADGSAKTPSSVSP
jgi:hypothetical protein